MYPRHDGLLALVLSVVLSQATPAVGQDTANETAKAQAGSVSRYVSPDFCGAVILHPSRILKSPSLASLPMDRLQALAANLAPNKDAPVNVAKLIEHFQPAKVQRVVLFIDPFPGGNVAFFPAAVVQFHEDVDGEKIFADVFKDAQAMELDGTACWVSFGAGMAQTPLLGVVPNKRILLIGPQPTVKKMLGQNAPGVLLEQLRRCSLDHDLVAVAAVEPVTIAFTKMTGKSTDELLQEKDGEKLGLLIQGIRSASLAVDLSGPTLAELRIRATANNFGATVEQTIVQALSGVKQNYSAIKKDLPQKFPNMPAPVAKTLAELGDELLAGLAVSRDGRDVTLTEAMPKTLAKLLKLLPGLLPAEAASEPSSPKR